MGMSTVSSASVPQTAIGPAGQVTETTATSSQESRSGSGGPSQVSVVTVSRRTVSAELAGPSLALIPAGRLPGLMVRASAVTPEGVAEFEATFAWMPKRVFFDVWRATVSLVDPDPAYRTPVPLALIRSEDDRTGNIVTAMPRRAKAEGVVEHVLPGPGMSSARTWGRRPPRPSRPSSRAGVNRAPRSSPRLRR